MHYRPLFYSLIILPTASIAAEPAPVAKQVAALQNCRTESDSAKRLACYDKAVDVLAAATASQEVVIVERSEVRKARKGLFGFALPRIGLLAGRDGNADDEADVARQEIKIISSRSIGYGKWRFTVEGGAVWETVEVSMSFNEPSPGRTVLLERGAMGGYFAKVGKGRRVQARRVS
jgi:hypothetical protein